MRHNVCGRKLNRTKSHRDAMFANMATSLFEHKKLHTTEAKAKELRPFAETLITKAKTALAKEKQSLLPQGQTIDIHSRRLVGRYVRDKAVLQELFDAIAPTVESRNGGYCRITKTGTRRGDAARTAIIELVDWSAPVDGAIALKKKKKQQKTKTKTKTVANESKSTKVVNETASEVAKDTIEKTVVETNNTEDTTIENATNAVENVADNTPETTETTTAPEPEKPAEETNNEQANTEEKA